LERAKAWFKEHGQSREHHTNMIMPFSILKESLLQKPLRIRGIALTAGMSRNFNIYTQEELQAFANKLLGAPVFIEHVSANNAIGKVSKTEWNPDSKALFYEAEIHDEEVAEKIRRGLIQHVSVAADYTHLDIVDGKIPHGLHNAELSLVAVPGIPSTSINIMEKLLSEQADQEFILLPVRDILAFLPDFFVLGWRNLAAGVQAIKGRLREKPEAEETFAFLFLKAKGWTLEQAQIWVKEHAQTKPTGVRTSPSPSNAQVSSMEEKKIEEKLGKLEEDMRSIKEHLKVPEPKTIAEMFSIIEGKLTQLDKRLSKLERFSEAAEDMTAEEIKQKIAELTQKLEGASEEEKARLQQQIQALQKALAAKTSGSSSNGGVQERVGQGIVVPIKENKTNKESTLKNLRLCDVMEGA